MSSPTITRNEDGSLTPSYPDPPRDSYEVAHVVLQVMIDDYNDVIAERDVARAELAAARLGHRAAVRALSQALGERDRLADGIRRMAARRCLCHGHLKSPGHGGPCCGVAGGRCVTCDARSLLDVAGDDSEERCGGLDPAYPGRSCGFLKEHDGPCIEPTVAEG